MQSYKGAEIHSVFFSVISVSGETNQKCLQHKILNESQEVHDSLSRFVCGHPIVQRNFGDDIQSFK